jgi:hypothetical protein
VFNTTFTVEGGKVLVPFMVVDGTVEDILANDSGDIPDVFFPFLGANPGGGDHVKLLADNTFGFEDTRGGDFDYDDIVIKMTVQV